MDNVYLNGLHALRRFEIRNLSNYTINVKLRSNLGSQIAFQLTNENLPDPDMKPSKSNAYLQHEASSSTIDSSNDSMLSSSNMTSSSLSNSSLSNMGTPAENSPHVSPPQSPLLITTNTVAAAAIGVFGYGDNSALHGHQFNQLFNYVNHIDEVLIEPGQSQKVIVAFLPDAKGKMRRQQSEIGNSGLENASVVDDGGYDEEETFNFFELNGLLFFFAYIANNSNANSRPTTAGKEIADRPQSPPSGVPDSVKSSISGLKVQVRKNSQISEMPPDLNYVASPASTLTSNIQSPLGLRDDLNVNSPSSATTNTSATSSAAPDHSLTIKFRSRVCKSVLWADISETGIMFNDCVVGGTYFKDFTIWNKSEIDLYWVLNTVDLNQGSQDSWLKFSDYDTGEPLDGKPIAAYSHRRIRVTFKPRDVGEFNYDLQLENANDAANFEEARIHAVVRSVLREETLVVSSGNVLDFADCCGGVWSKQKLVLRNVSEQPLDINFESENAEVAFQLRVEDLMMEIGGPSSTDEGRTSSENLLDRDTRTGLGGNNSWGSLANSRTESEVSGASSMVSSRASSPNGMERDRWYLDRGNNNNTGSALSLTGMKRDIDGYGSATSLDMVDMTSMKRTSSASNSIKGGGSASHFHDRSSRSSVLGLPHSSSFKFGNNSLIEDAEGRGVLNENSYSGGVGMNGGEFMLIEEITLKPGAERTIEVCYRPEKETFSTDYRGGKLTRRNFRIILSYGTSGSYQRERNVIQCKARTCTSFVEVMPKVVNFGDTDVGTLKSAPVQIRNCSDLTAHVELRVVSKVLNCFRDEIIIPPKQSIEVKLDIYPRKVNPDYRKQITVVNLLNRDNDQLLEVKSCNIDKNRVTFHSLFYRILTPTSSNFMDFGSVVLNCPSVRTFTINNISKKKLLLELTSSLPNEIKIYMKGVVVSNRGHDAGALGSTLHHRREKLLESMGDRRVLKRGANENANNAGIVGSSSNLTGGQKRANVEDGKPFLDSVTAASDYLDLAAPALREGAKRSPRKKRHQHHDHERLKGVKNPFLKLAMKEDFGRSRSLMNIFGDDSSSQQPSPLPARDATFSTSQEVAERSRLGSAGEEIDQQGLQQQSQQARSELSRPGSANASAGANSSLTAKELESMNVSKMATAALADLLEDSKLGMDDLLSALEINTGAVPPLFPKPANEEKYVRAQLLLRRELDSLVADGRLVPVSMVDIPPQNEITIVLVFVSNGENKPYVQGKPRKQDAKVFLRLLEFDRDIQRPEFETLLKGDTMEIPVRELMLRSSVCRSIMDLGQKNINFGGVDKGERRNKTIVIRNRSEAPLLYAIRKSGSIASGDIIIGEGKMGVIRGYGKKEVDFLFDPSLPGLFYEKLVIENVQDPYNDQTLIVKANIKKPSHFYLQTLNIDFGVCLINEVCANVQHIVISNTSTKQTRIFEIRFDPQKIASKNCMGEISFDVVEGEHDDAAGATDVTGGGKSSSRKKRMLVSKEMEEQIESLEQKLKIAKRKGRDDKVQKLTSKLEKLRSGIMDDDDKYQGVDEAKPVTEMTSVAAKAFETGIISDTNMGDVLSEGSVPPSMSGSYISGVGGVGEKGLLSDSGQTEQFPQASPSGTNVPDNVSLSSSGAFPSGFPHGVPSNLNPQSSQLALTHQSQQQHQQHQQSTTVSSSQPAAPQHFKYRKTENSIIFSLGPRAIKTIAVYFRPVAKTFDEQQEGISPIVEDDFGIGSPTALSTSPSISRTNTSVILSGTLLTSSADPTFAKSNTEPRLSSEDNLSSPPMNTIALPPESNSEIFQAQLYVHEHKNTDIMKKVTFKALICYDHPTYLQALSEVADNGLNSDRKELDVMLDGSTVLSEGKDFVGKFEVISSLQDDNVSPGAASTISDKLLKLPGKSLETLLPPVVKNASMENLLGLNRDSLALQSKLAEKSVAFDEKTMVQSGFFVELTSIDLNRIVVNERRECYITLVSKSDDSVEFEMLDNCDLTESAEKKSILEFPDPQGTLQPKETKRYYFHMTPQILGRQTRSLEVRDVRTGAVHQVTFNFFAIESAYLRFPSLPHGDTSSPELSLGVCYVDSTRRFAKTTSLEVENVSENDLFVMVSSNLAQQCFIFQDSKLESPLTELAIPKGGRVTIYIALQPYLSSGSNKKWDDVRTLIGGIKFSIYINEKTDENAESAIPPANILGLVQSKTTLFQIMSQTVKFTSTIGQSMFALSDSAIDFGCTDVVGKVYSGEFTILNVSKLPLDYKVESQSGLIRVDNPVGRIAEMETNPKSHIVRFQLAPQKTGFFLDYLNVYNLNNSSQMGKIEIRLFVDPNRLLIAGPALALSPTTTDASFTNLPSLSWDNIYVNSEGMVNESTGTPSFFIEKSHRSDSFPLYEKSFEIENVFDEDISLVAKSDLDCVVRWGIIQGPNTELISDVASDAQVNEKLERWKPVAGGEITLQSRQKAMLFVRAPLPTSLYEENVIRLLSGEKISRQGLLLLENTKSASVMKVVRLVSTFCRSLGEAEPNIIDVGRVGYLNTWEDVNFSFNLKNLSDAPLCYEFAPTDVMEIVAIAGNKDPSAKKRIDSRGVHRVDAVLKPRQIPNFTSGPRVFDLEVVNSYNPHNVMAVRIHTILTSFELKFERLDNGEISLPPLYHPNTPQSLPCDNWFSIVNTSDYDVKFEAGFDLAPDIAQFVRVEILSRFSNSPLVGTMTLAPRGSIEVRVRAYARDDSRLPSQGPNCNYLLNPDGLTFGKIWVTMKQIAGMQAQLERPEAGQGEENDGLPAVISGRRITEDIPVRGSIIEGPTFALSDRRLELKNAFVSDSDGSDDDFNEDGASKNRKKQAKEGRRASRKADQDYSGRKESVVITNMSPSFPLEFMVNIEYPMEFPSGTDIIKISPLDDNKCGVVSPGESYVLQVELADVNVRGVSEDVKIHFWDMKSLNKQRQTVYVSIVEDVRVPRPLSIEPRTTTTRRSDVANTEERYLEKVDSQHDIRDGSDAELLQDDVSEVLSAVSAHSNTSLTERQPIVSATTVENMVPPSAVRRQTQGRISLRGCKRVSDVRGGFDLSFLYELDLGQQDLGSNTISKKITLENTSSEPIMYRIRMLNDSDRSWIVFSRNEGVLEANRSGGNTSGGTTPWSNSITINFMTNTRGIYSTYILIENAENPADLKILRASIEIVARQNVRRTATGAIVSGSAPYNAPSLLSPDMNNHVFDVFVNGVDAEQTNIEMTNLFYENEYSARSIVIFNRESVPLEFTIKSNLPHDHPSELLFSLSRSSAKMFRTMTIEPESRVRIYIRFRPSLEGGFAPVLSDATYQTLEEANKADQKIIEIWINCRLVKDYQKIVTLVATCRRPQIRVSSTDFGFKGFITKRVSGTDTSRDEDSWVAQFEPSYSDVTISNLLVDNLEYELVNDSLYFDVAPVLDEVDGMVNLPPSIVTSTIHSVLSGKKVTKLRVSPKMDAILKNAEFLRRVCKSIYFVLSNCNISNNTFLIPYRKNTYKNTSLYTIGSDRKKSTTF